MQTVDEMSQLHICPPTTVSHLSSQQGRKDRKKGRCRRRIMEQDQHSQSPITPIIEEQIPIEDRPSTSCQTLVQPYNTLIASYQQSTLIMISSSSIPAPITAHKGQGRLRC